MKNAGIGEKSELQRENQLGKIRNFLDSDRMKEGANHPPTVHLGNSKPVRKEQQLSRTKTKTSQETTGKEFKEFLYTLNQDLTQESNKEGSTYCY